ncbi:MAG: hypothetical protein AB7G37_12360 [Solirubrobacteraceae bacterium]
MSASAFPSFPPLLRLVNPVAERAILVGDPGRALELAQSLLERPLMCNHQRGLWGYTGNAVRDGEPLTIQSIGSGAPSAVVALGELHAAGLRRVVRAGSAVPLRSDAASIDGLRAISAAWPADGTSRALGAEGAQRPDPALLARAEESGLACVELVSVDLLPGELGAAGADAPAGVEAADRQTAALLATAARIGVAAAAVVAFPDPRDDDEDRRATWWRAVGDAAGTTLG